MYLGVPHFSRAKEWFTVTIGGETFISRRASKSCSKGLEEPVHDCSYNPSQTRNTTSDILWFSSLRDMYRLIKNIKNSLKKYRVQFIILYEDWELAIYGQWSYRVGTGWWMMCELIVHSNEVLVLTCVLFFPFMNSSFPMVLNLEVVWPLPTIVHSKKWVFVVYSPGQVVYVFRGVFNFILKHENIIH